MSVEEQEEKNESFITHLEALRETLLKCVYAIAIVLPFTFFVSPKALNYLINMLVGEKEVVLNYFSPVEVFLIQIKLALVIDLVICFPYIAKKIWDFLLPALYENERKFIKSTVLISSSLFIAGVCFCLFAILPLVIGFGKSFETETIHAMFNISTVVTLALWMSVVFGLMFQVPLITVALIKSGIISYETIADKRPYVVVAILIIAGVLTPPDVISQIMLGLPTYLLFETGLLFSKKYSKKEF